MFFVFLFFMEQFALVLIDHFSLIRLKAFICFSLWLVSRYFFSRFHRVWLKQCLSAKLVRCDFHNLLWFCSVNLCVCEAFGDERDFLFEFEFSVLFQHCFYFHLKASKIAKLRWGQTYFDKKKPSHLHLIAIRIFSCRGWIAFPLSVCVTERMK